MKEAVYEKKQETHTKVLLRTPYKKIIQLREKDNIHHHHVPEGLGVFPVP